MSREQKELICIGCPLGCPLRIQMDGETILEISGNTCRRGEDYARKELTDPRRIVTSTVKVNGGEQAAVPVKTVSDIPKDQIFACMRQLKEVQVCAPVKIGDIIVENVAGTGIAVAATKDVRHISE